MPGDWCAAIMGKLHYITIEQVNQSILDHRKDGHRTTNKTYPKHINKLPQCKNPCSYGVIETVWNAFITGLHSLLYATEGSALVQLGLPSSRHITLPPYRMNKPVISVQTQSFFHWLAAPGLLPGAQLWHHCLSFMCHRATRALEFVTTMDAVFSPTGHVVVSPHPEPKIHCGIEFVFNFSIPWENK